MTHRPGSVIVPMNLGGGVLATERPDRVFSNQYLIIDWESALPRFEMALAELDPPSYLLSIYRSEMNISRSLLPKIIK